MESVTQRKAIIEGLPIAHGEVAYLLQRAVDEQSTIGWDKLLWGMGSATWKLIQNIIDTNNPKRPQRYSSAWMNAVMHQLKKFSLRCNTSSAIPIHIHAIPLEHLLKLSRQTVEQWVSLIAHQVRVTKHNFKILLSRHKPMAAHLRTMRYEVRNQAKERRQPETPRKAHRMEIHWAGGDVTNFSFYFILQLSSTQRSKYTIEFNSIQLNSFHLKEWNLIP